MWRRIRFEWESQLEVDLNLLLSRVTLKKNIEDIQVWGKENSGIFSVSAAYKCLTKHSADPQSKVYRFL